MKIKNVQRIIFLVFFSLFSNQAWAVNWIYFDKAAVGDVYYGKDSMKKVNKSNFLVWNKIVLSKEAKTKYFSILKGIHKEPQNPSMLSYYKKLVEIDCANRKIKDTSMTFYDEKGKVIYALPKSESGEWIDILPDTVGEKLFKIVSCETVPPKEATAPKVEEVVPPKEATAPKIEESVAPKEATAPKIEEVVPPKEAAAPKVEETVAPKEAAAPKVEEVVAPKEAAAPKVEEVVPPKEATAPKVEEPVVPQAKEAPQFVQEVKKEESVKPVIIEKGRQTLDVKFDFDKVTIKKYYYKDINALAEVMKQYPDLSIVIEGYTCNIGPVAYNKILSQRRAYAVKKFMVKKYGIDAKRLNAKGFGKDKPVASNATKEGRKKNRRAEAVLVAIEIK